MEASLFKSALLVFAGAGAGGCLRFLLGVWLVQPKDLPFSLSVLTANLVGGVLAGCLFALIGPSEIKSSPYGLFLMTGFLGGLTTFSAFTAEGVLLFMHSPAWFIAQVFSHVGLCFIGFLVAFKVLSAV